MTFPTGHALLIGVGTYQNVPRLNVPVTATDAQELASILHDPQYCGYPREQVTLLHDDTATRDGILDALDDLAKRTTEGDTVLLFYSGHGEFGEDDAYYLTTSDMRKNDQRKVVAGTAVKEASLLEKLRAIKAKRLILLFNACHSGEISPVLGGESADDVTEGAQSLPDNAAAAILSTGEGRVIITACRENQFSFVGSGTHTIFAQALLDGLRGKGTSSNGGFISAFDLYTYLYYAVDRAIQKIPLATRKQYAGGVQQPELTILKGVGPMPVALYKGASATLSDFDTSEELDEETAVSRIEKKYSERMLRSMLTVSIGDTKTAGRDIVEKNAGRDIVEAQGNINQAGRDLLQGNQFGGDFVGGDKVAGDKVAGDKVMGDKRTVNTGGGDYAEGNIDKRQGAFVSDGTVQGFIVGQNTGVVNNYYNTLQPETPRTSQPEIESDAQRKLLKELQRRLGLLELQKARQGIGTDPAILMEIEDLQRQIADVRKQLG